MNLLKVMKLKSYLIINDMYHFITSAPFQVKVCDIVNVLRMKNNNNNVIAEKHVLKIAHLNPLALIQVRRLITPGD